MGLVAAEEMAPPVALLVYRPDQLERAVFYPYARFSPEWQAARFAAERGIPFRFIDLPLAHRLAEPEEEAPDGNAEEAPAREDPMEWIARAAGDSDGESWWERMIEERRDPRRVFEAVAELMTALREELGERDDPLERRREAHMRLSVRKAEKDGFSRIAVVVGAWHVPALHRATPAREDEARLKGLPKVKVAATWTPWTYERLTTRSGYGAGVRSPAYYEHLWDSDPAEATAGWLLKAARLLREEDLEASPASVVEAVRLAEAVAAVRDRPRPGLAELIEAARAVLCHGLDEPMRLISERLIVGLRLGRIPPEAPSTPLAADLEAEQRRLRLRPEASARVLDLDLRNETDLARSHLLRRLRLLNVAWAKPDRAARSKGTFHEVWRLEWKPEMAISLVDAGRWGNTVLSAATGRAVDLARTADDLPAITGLAEAVLSARLPDAVGPVMAQLESASAAATDVAELLDALPPLATILRYGDVRRTDIEAVGHVFGTIFARGAIGLAGACASLDDDAAGAMADRIGRTEQIVSLLQDEDRQELWRRAVRDVADGDDFPGVVAGRACRVLLDAGKLEGSEAANRLARVSSPGMPAARAAAWIEGFLGGSGAILLHDDNLWHLLDAWVAGLDAEAFKEVLPLLRRTFARFPAPERRQMGERAKGADRTAWPEIVFDEARAGQVRPLIARLLGREEATWTTNG